MKALSVLGCTGLILACGITHGIITDRWVESEELEAAVGRFQYFPLQIGSWKGELLTQVPGKNTGLAASTSVCYCQMPTGKKVTVFFGCGRPGPVSIHTPDVCYSACGFQMDSIVTSRFSRAESGVEGKMYTARFKRTKGGEQTSLRIYWTWYAEGKWDVSENPRLQYHNGSVLYKLYVIHELDSSNEGPDPLICTDFLPTLTQELERTVIRQPQ